MSAENRANFDDYTLLSTSLYPDRAVLELADHDKFTGRYSLRGTVGMGGVGRVLLGFDERIGREVAIKEMLKSDENSDINSDLTPRLRFLREAQVTGRLEHPGIVPVYDLGTTSRGSPYYVMRFIRGDTLTKALKACNLEQPEPALAKRLQLLDRLIQVCEAMAYAHSKSVVHRDLKPGNIVLGSFGETIILDWGLAKIGSEQEDQPNWHAAVDFAEAGDDGLTQSGEILGTPGYMAPEQVDPGYGEVDTRTDVFALGCILYHILVGHPPLRGGLAAVVERLRSPEPMPSPRDSPIPVPTELTAICEKALDKDKDRRFRDAEKLTEELRAYRDGRLISTYAYSRKELLRRFVSRNQVPLAAALAVLAAIVIGAGFAFEFAMEADQARKAAVAESKLAVQAQQRAESALADATRISDNNLITADRLADNITNAIDAIRDSLEQLADSVSFPGNAAAMTSQLESLRVRYPGVESFAAALAPGKIFAVAPVQYASAIDADTSQFEHNRLATTLGKPVLSRLHQTPEGFEAITLVVPVKRGKTIPGFISARLKAAEFLGRLLSTDIRTAAKTVWVIQDDGLILYDTHPAEIGENLFREERFVAIPELRRLAGEIARQKTGVGYYRGSDPATGAVLSRIASWETLRPAENQRWRVVVLERWD
jgi:serine/threonine protein kinase